MVLDDAALSQLFLDARSFSYWHDTPVDDATLKRVYDLARMGPTLGNLQPMRVVFVKSREAKERLKPCLSPGNVDKVMSAPVTAIVAFDVDFTEKSAQLRPGLPAMNLAPEPRERAARQSGTLGGAYLLLAARACGLDCGPMGGFDNAKVDAAFFPGTSWRSNFLMNLGHGNREKLHPRLPRLAFDEACKVE